MELVFRCLIASSSGACFPELASRSLFPGACFPDLELVIKVLELAINVFPSSIQPHSSTPKPGGLNGLEAPQMRRDRAGIIRTRTRERPRGANRGQYLYTVLFSDPATNVRRLPLDNDADAPFLAET